MDNDDVPATWDIGEVDGSVGRSVMALGRFLTLGPTLKIGYLLLTMLVYVSSLAYLVMRMF
jgi:hypothetical protein